MFPAVMKQLVEEIRTTFTADSEINFRNTANLPYLAAVIEESLRMYPPFVTKLPRLVPPGGGIVDGHWLPENVEICFFFAARLSTLLDTPSVLSLNS
jgi:hypothetical protein